MIRKILLGCAAALPLASAYSLSLPMMNLWDVFVEQVFGSFWMAVIALSLIILIILWMGNISAWTSMAYVTMFIFALAIGYGPALITIILFIGLLSWAVFEILQYYNTSSR